MSHTADGFVFGAPHFTAQRFCRRWPWQWFTKNNCFRDSLAYEFQNGTLPLMSTAQGEATGGGRILVSLEEQIFSWLKSRASCNFPSHLISQYSLNIMSTSVRACARAHTHTCTHTPFFYQYM